MPVDQTNELFAALRQRHDANVAQLKKLFESEDGMEIFDLASKVLGSPIGAADWLTRRHFGLNGAIPAAVAFTAEGREAVRTYLLQIEYGVYV